MRGALRAAPAALACILGLIAGSARAEPVDEADLLPAATTITRVTWTRGPASTRIRFQGILLPLPAVSRPSPGMLRLDFSAVDAPSVPQTMQVGTPDVVSIVSIPGSVGLLPEDVSLRVLVTLSAEGLGYAIESGPDGITLLIGEEGATGASDDRPAPEVVLVEPPSDARRKEQPPELAEMLERPQSIRLNAAMSVRAAPLAIAGALGTVSPGEAHVIDARRGEWVHLQDGGWIRLPQVVVPAGAVPDAQPARRTPAAWSVVTLGTNLDVRLEEVLAGDEKAAALERLYAGKVKLARFIVSVDKVNPYSFRLPSKKGRVILDLAGGRSVESLDPVSLPLAGPGSRARLDVLLAAPALVAGSAWETFLVFPADLDFLAVTDARVEINGLLHRLFRVPGSGEPER